MTQAKFAIVVTAYNRAVPLGHLLDSLNKIRTDLSIPLVISIDNKGTEEVNKVANDFQWEHGEKKVIIHPEKLGLRAHFVWAGDQTYEYENVLFLEDDLYVSPYVTDYVLPIIEKYRDDDRVTAGSLYNPLLCEFDKCKFYQYEDGYDNFFLAHPYWGNVWMKNKWDQFKKWLETYEERNELLPPSVQRWNVTSFKKMYLQYLEETKRYVVYPRVSYVTNMGEAGLHSKTQYRQFQTAFQRGTKMLTLSDFDESRSVYDVFFEYAADLVKKACPDLADYDLTVDLRGNHDRYRTEYVLTRRKVKKAIKTYADDLRPPECNVLEQIVAGDRIALAKSEDVIFEAFYARKQFADDAFSANYHAGLKEVLAALLLVIKQRFGK